MASLLNVSFAILIFKYPVTFITVSVAAALPVFIEVVVEVTDLVLSDVNFVTGAKASFWQAERQASENIARV